MLFLDLLQEMINNDFSLFATKNESPEISVFLLLMPYGDRYKTKLDD